MYNELEKFLSSERLKGYLDKTKTKSEAIDLYEKNIFLSSKLYFLLNFFEIFLRNYCNEKLKKELGSDWYMKTDILLGDNKEKGQWAIDQIKLTKEKIEKNKKEKRIVDYPILLDDIVSNLELGFWTNLFIANYNNTIWRPYLRFIFKDFERKKLFKILDDIRKLRNRIFHFEPIVFDTKLKEKYSNIKYIIEYISNKKISAYIEEIAMRNF